MNGGIFTNVSKFKKGDLVEAIMPISGSPIQYGDRGRVQSVEWSKRWNTTETTIKFHNHSEPIKLLGKCLAIKKRKD